MSPKTMNSTLVSRYSIVFNCHPLPIEVLGVITPTWECVYWSQQPQKPQANLSNFLQLILSVYNWLNFKLLNLPSSILKQFCCIIKMRLIKCNCLNIPNIVVSWEALEALLLTPKYFPAKTYYGKIKRHIKE